MAVVQQNPTAWNLRVPACTRLLRKVRVAGKPKSYIVYMLFRMLALIKVNKRCLTLACASPNQSCYERYLLRLRLATRKALALQSFAQVGTNLVERRLRLRSCTLNFFLSACLSISRAFCGKCYVVMDKLRQTPIIWPSPRTLSVSSYTW